MKPVSTRRCGYWALGCIVLFGLVLAVAALAEGLHAQRPDKPPKPMFIDVSVERARHTRGKSGWDDDSSQDVKMTIGLNNRNTSQDYPDLTGYFYVVAQEVTNKKHFKLIIKESEELKLLRGQRIQHESSEVHLEFDDHEPYRFGFKYYGYVYIVEDKSGKTFLGSAAPDTLWQKLDKLSEKNLDAEFNF